jgi:hypothetical protein
MADEAFALSPIDARPAQPTDADYDAICSAFRETARGRWFLDEYARRNRNADTRLVLDAVARLEANFESQKLAQAAQAAPTAADLWPELARLLATARIEIAQHLLREGQDAGLETIQAGAETIRSIAWALRERGFDARICDAFDTQVKTLLKGHAALAAAMAANAGSNAQVLAALDHLIESARGLLTEPAERRDDEARLDEMVDAVAGAMADDESFDEAGTFEIDDSEPPSEVRVADDATPHTVAPEGFLEVRGDEADLNIADEPLSETPIVPALSEPEINRQRLYEAKVIAPLVAAPASGDETASQLDAEMSSEAEALSEETPAPADNAAPVQPEPAMSLGHAVLASGAIRRPGSARPDPLAPFRRMSQAEKIAFFS